MKKRKEGLVVLIVLAVVLPCIIGSACAWGYEVISSDSSGAGKNDFHVGEPIYAHAHTAVPNIPVDIYVVNNKEVWSLYDGLSDVSGGVETVETDDAGWMPVTPIWTGTDNEDAGDYDIIIDANRNAMLDGDDLVDHDLEVGFSVNVPEFATIAIPAAAIIGLFLFFNHRKRKKE